MWMLFVDVYDVKAQREVSLTPGQPSSLINQSFPFTEMPKLFFQRLRLHVSKSAQMFADPELCFTDASLEFFGTALTVPSLHRTTDRLFCMLVYVLTCLTIHSLIRHHHAIVISKDSSFLHCSSLKSLKYSHLNLVLFP